MAVARAEEMDALAERVEKLTGPDREVDKAIFLAVDAPETVMGSKVIAWFGDGPFGCNTEDGMRHLDYVNAPFYTASLDAAMSLLVNGSSFVLNCFDVSTKPRVQKAHAHVSSIKINGEWHAGWLADAATPALALTAACLRAQASIIREARR